MLDEDSVVLLAIWSWSGAGDIGGEVPCMSGLVDEGHEGRQSLS